MAHAAGNLHRRLALARPTAADVARRARGECLISSSRRVRFSSSMGGRRACGGVGADRLGGARAGSLPCRWRANRDAQALGSSSRMLRGQAYRKWRGGKRSRGRSFGPRSGPRGARAQRANVPSTSRRSRRAGSAISSRLCARKILAEPAHRRASRMSGGSGDDPECRPDGVVGGSIGRTYTFPSTRSKGTCDFLGKLRRPAREDSVPPWRLRNQAIARLVRHLRTAARVAEQLALVSGWRGCSSPH